MTRDHARVRVFHASHVPTLPNKQHSRDVHQTKDTHSRTHTGNNTSPAGAFPRTTRVSRSFVNNPQPTTYPRVYLGRINTRVFTLPNIVLRSHPEQQITLSKSALRTVLTIASRDNGYHTVRGGGVARVWLPWSDLQTLPNFRVLRVRHFQNTQM